MKTLLIALAAVCLSPLSAEAKVDSNTPTLIDTFERHGFEVIIDPVDDCLKGVGGLINFQEQYVALCTEGRSTADYHDTVRHEAVHLAQYCATKKRGHDQLEPLIDSRLKLKEFIESALPDKTIVAIKSYYERKRWLPELEASAVALMYDAEWVSELVDTWCTV